ncbi:hypothetical protein VO63_01275 [Streptomyces showdoensis]|uniref:Uncharacterized protein n=1 Tax=Streptomyces showdoensis TaxID=68268 RepID=A0A2P2GX58_STREW|nr:hypothetical protein VO63_01275 [Streptomyces showdoensis]
MAPVATAAPAQASQFDCQQYLLDVGYKVGAKTRQACSYGGSVTHAGLCYPILVSIGVKSLHATTACRLS